MTPVKQAMGSYKHVFTLSEVEGEWNPGQSPNQQITEKVFLSD